MELKCLSSMATRLMLAELVENYQKHSSDSIIIESVGGVDAVRRVLAGEALDVVILASEAIDKLILAGTVLPGSKVDLANSGVAVALREGALRPDIATEDGLRHAVLAAKSIAYSTGPSGVALARLFERWGIAEEIRDRVVQPPPGIPVGSLLARGEVEIGFQQLGELIYISGITVLGPLPAAIRIITTFSAALCNTCTQPLAARAFIAYMASSDAAEAKRRQGMDPS